MRTTGAFTIAAMMSIAALPARAQERDTIPLAPMVVTATRLPEPVTALANDVSVISGTELERAGIATVADAIRSLAGAAVVQSGSYGGVTSLFLRGGQSDYVRVLVDGVPINGSGGALNLANLSTLNVDRIEVVRGPSSVLYGSDAVSGVIQVFTRRGEVRRSTLRAQGGGYGSSDVAAELAAGRGSAGLTLAAAQQATDGLYDFNNHYRDGTLSASARFAGPRGDLQLTARYGDALLHYPTDGSGNQVDSNAYATTRTTTLSLDAGRFMTPALEARLLLGYHREAGRTEDAQDNAGDTTGLYDYHSRSLDERGAADARINAHLAGASILTVGAAAEQEKTSSAYTSNFGPGGGPDARRTNRALYAQLVAAAARRIQLQAGARLDDNERFGRFGTWRLGIVAHVLPLTRVRAIFGTAFREPAFAENYSTAFTVGNPNLKPERSSMWEVGVERALAGPGGSMSVSYFSQRFRDMIQYTFAPPPPDSANYFNIAGANASGVEIGAHLAPSTALRLDAQVTFLHTGVSDSGYDGAQFAPGRPLIRRPGRTAAVGAEWTPLPGLSGGMRVAYTGRREDLDFSQFPAARVVLVAYARMDLWADVALVHALPGRPSFTLTGRLDNATGAKYTEIYGFRTPGRVLRVGLRMDAGR